MIAHVLPRPAPEAPTVRPLSPASVLASVIGLASSAALASDLAPGVAPSGADVPAWLAWMGSALMTLAPIALDRWLAYRAAKALARATALERAAELAERDDDPTNDDDAKEARARADELRAEAEAANAAARGPKA